MELSKLCAADRLQVLLHHNEMTDVSSFGADPSVVSLTPAARRSLAEWWSSRARAELDASGHFRLMAERLVLRSAPREIVGMVERAIDDEIRHAESCSKLASGYLAEPLDLPEVRDPEEPSFGHANAELVTTLHVVLSSCISEGIASVFLRTCFLQAVPPLVRSVLKSQLEDEIEHARIGWAHLATSSDDEKREVSRAIPDLLRVAENAWLSTETPRSRPLGHGSLSRADLEAVVEDAIRGLIVPGFAHVGIACPSR